MAWGSHLGLVYLAQVWETVLVLLWEMVLGLVWVMVWAWAWAMLWVCVLVMMWVLQWGMALEKELVRNSALEWRGLV
jgi:hypothetical protein